MSSSNCINILSEFIANQIAAGEVVQRPESVVKELVENSLDAKATTIAVFIKDAGKTLIHIVDDGIGMTLDDLKISLLRHSTSKIHSTEDLAKISTFGFRGEALPAIASVSLMDIRTKQQNEEFGWKLISEPLKEFKIEQMQTEKGTQIFVRNLFYNTPARRKFLKTNITEQKYIYETMQKFALSNFDKRFIFYDNNSLIFDVKPEQLEERIKSVLRVGEDDNNRLIEVDMSINDIHIFGYIGQPQFARKSNVTQYFFLNGRSINSKNLSYAVYSAFEPIIEKKLKPFFILNIELDYNAVDVNVHPQKSEVKFEDEKLIFSCVKKSVSNALKLHNLLPELLVNSPTSTNLASYELVDTEYKNGKTNAIYVDKLTGEILDAVNLNKSHHNNLIHKEQKNSTSQNYYRPFVPISNKSYFANKNINGVLDELYCKDYTDSVTTSSTITEVSEEVRSSNIQQIFTKKLLNGDIFSNLWQFHNKYIFLQTQDGLLAIDQHNAHERVIYERLIAKTNDCKFEKQKILFPLSVKLNSMQVLAIKEIGDSLKNIGFDFEFADKHKQDINDINFINITSQPSDINFNCTVNSFIDIINDYLQNEELKHIDKHKRIIATLACKSAIKAGEKLSTEEMSSLVINLLNCEMQHICPHGRPIIILSTLIEWDKKFGRI